MEYLDRVTAIAPDCLTTLKGNKPNFLKKGLAWKENYERNQDSNRFKWGKFSRVNISELLVESLGLISDQHCFYCDINRVIPMINRPEIDHFCPKTIRPIKAYYYPNLFLSCSSCNGNKSDKFDRKYLLNFTDPNYNFDDYYYIDFATGKVQTRTDIEFNDRYKARYTLVVLGINKGARPKIRREELNAYNDSNNKNLADYSYRFFIRRAS